MNYESITIRDVPVYGLSVELTSSQSENAKIIAQHWKLFNLQLRVQKVWLGKDWAKFGLTKKLNNQYFYTTAVESEKVIEGFEHEVINAGEYLRFHHVGSMARMKNTISDIYRNVLPAQNIQLDTQRNLIHVERYDARFNWNNPSSLVEIYIPLGQ
jgi:predicted transcriptional regulator YdeE